MVRLTILSGSRAGASFDFGAFPIRIGRNSEAQVRLEDPGVWDRHLEISLTRPEGFILTVDPAALASINGESVNRRLLRNGDLIQVGPTRIQFWLGGIRQIGLRPRELATWAGLALLCVVQLVLIYRFLR